MSLRAFHIIFVVSAVALSVFVALWGFRNYAATKEMSSLSLGLIFLACAVALGVYGVRVYRKLRDLP